MDIYQRNEMENINSSSLNNECKKDKELFFSILKRIILALCVLLLLFILNEKDKESKNQILNSFKDGNEVICKSLIVSIKNGYKFEENKEVFISDGVNIFDIRKCKLR
jgi:preprotein translocase subunit YajC